MKYIITEDRLDKVINKYIDYMFENTEFTYYKSPITDLEFNYLIDNDGNDLITYSVQDRNLYIMKMVTDKLINMFGIDMYTAKNKIGDWFWRKYDLFPSSIYSV